MVTNATSNRGEDSTIFLCVAGFALIFLVIPAVYAAKAEVVNRFLLGVAKLEIRPFLGFSEEARIAWAHLSGLTPADLQWEEMQRILNYAGTWARWPLGFLLAGMGFLAFFMGRTDGLVRRFNMESLLANNAESFPCLRPVVGRGKYLLSPESYDAGLWRIARSPIQFAVEHRLLLRGDGTAYEAGEVLRNGLGTTASPAFGHAVLDEAKALEVFKEQLGRTAFAGPETLSPFRRSLLAAFIAYACGDKNAAIRLLDDMSNAYEEQDGKASCSLIEDAAFQARVDKLLAKHGGILHSDASIARHNAYELPWFMAVLYRARQKGVLASSQFLFVRPLDRPLWYALNQCGGRVGWPEAFAAWAHYQAEEAAGKTLTEPDMGRAVASLKAALNAQGWLRPESPKEEEKAEVEERKPEEKADGGNAPEREETQPPHDRDAIVDILNQAREQELEPF